MIYLVRNMHGELVCSLSKEAFDMLVEKDIGTFIPFNGKNKMLHMIYRLHSDHMWCSSCVSLYFWKDYTIAPEAA